MQEATSTGTAETEMVSVLKSAKQSGDVLDVAAEAKRIGALYEVSPEKVAQDLTESGLLVGINMMISSPR